MTTDHYDCVRYPNHPDLAPEQGWAAVLSPMGASLHVRAGSLAEDVCREWLLLQSGRGALCPTDALEWFTADELSAMPSWLRAELLASSLHTNDFVGIIATDSLARTHMLHLPASVFGAEPEEWLHLDECVDISRRFEARAVAARAVAEALCTKFQSQIT